MSSFSKRNSVAMPHSEFKMETDPDRPPNTVNQSIIIEDIDINGHK